MKPAAPRLGRGLAALLGDAPSAAMSASSVGVLDTDLLTPNPFQPRARISDDDLRELAASIRTQGVLQPILVRPNPNQAGHFQIIAGERRWRAARLAGVATVPCFIRDMGDTDVSAAALVENLQRKDLNPIEEAEGFRRLIEDFGLTQEELGAAIGKSRSHVANLLRLLSLPGDVIEHVRAGSLSAGHARAALACPDPSRAAEQMIANGLSVRQAEALSTARPLPAQPSQTHRPQSDSTADLRAVEADLAERLGLSVAISFNGRGGTVSLRYQTLDQLDHIIARLGRT